MLDDCFELEGSHGEKSGSLQWQHEWCIPDYDTYIWIMFILLSPPMLCLLGLNSPSVTKCLSLHLVAVRCLRQITAGGLRLKEARLWAATTKVRASSSDSFTARPLNFIWNPFCLLCSDNKTAEPKGLCWPQELDKALICASQRKNTVIYAPRLCAWACMISFLRLSRTDQKAPALDTKDSKRLSWGYFQVSSLFSYSESTCF